MNNRVFKSLVVVTLGAALITGCSPSSTPSDSTSSSTPVASESSSPAPEESQSPEPTPEETPEPVKDEPTASPSKAPEKKVDIKSLKVGDKVPASQVDDAKKAGVNVYRTLDGTGEVVKRGTLPKIIAKEFQQTGQDTWKGPGSPADKMAAEAREAGVSAVVIYPLGANFDVALLEEGVPNMVEGGMVYDGEAAAMKIAKDIASRYGVKVIPPK